MNGVYCLVTSHPPPPRSIGIIGLARNSPQNTQSKGLRGQNLENKRVSRCRRSVNLDAHCLRSHDRRLGLWMTRLDVTLGCELLGSESSSDGTGCDDDIFVWVEYRWVAPRS